MMRLFIALPLPATVKDALVQLRRQLATQLPSSALKWAKPNQYHLTLKFLGDVEEEQLPHIEQALHDAGETIPPLSLAATGLGMFPHDKKPKVLWVGISGDVENLQRLQTQLDVALEPWFAREERSFSPHLTLARIRFADRPLTRALQALPKELVNIELGGWASDAVELIQSELRPEGAEYTTLLQMPLRGDMAQGD